eukprot:310577-Amphidinium_carterae.1
MVSINLREHPCLRGQHPAVLPDLALATARKPAIPRCAACIAQPEGSPLCDMVVPWLPVIMLQNGLAARDGHRCGGILLWWHPHHGCNHGPLRCQPGGPLQDHLQADEDSVT